MQGYRCPVRSIEPAFSPSLPLTKMGNRAYLINMAHHFRCHLCLLILIAGLLAGCSATENITHSQKPPSRNNPAAQSQVGTQQGSNVAQTPYSAPQPSPPGAVEVPAQIQKDEAAELARAPQPTATASVIPRQPPYSGETASSSLSLPGTIPPAPANATILTLADDRGDVAIEANTALWIQLEGNPTTGYTWSVEHYDPSVLTLESHEYITQSNKSIGSGGVFLFRFQALAPGQTTVKLSYSRPWESGPSAKVFENEVTVE